MKKESATVSKIFVYLAILISVIGVAVFIALHLFQEKDVRDISYTVIISELDASLSENVKIGDSIVSCVTKREIGKVSEIAKRQSVREVYSEKRGSLVISSLPDKYDLTLTLSASAEHSGGIFAGGIELKIGKSLYLFSKNLYFEGIIGEFYD